MRKLLSTTHSRSSMGRASLCTSASSFAISYYRQFTSLIQHLFNRIIAFSFSRRSFYTSELICHFIHDMESLFLYCLIYGEFLF